MTLDQFYSFDHPVPYSYVLNKNNQYIYYFGSRHSFDPDDSQFQEIKTFFNDFLEKTTQENSVILVEGGGRPVVESEKSAILADAEMGFVTYIANVQNRQVVSPEISGKERFQLLLKHFTKEEIAYYCFVQVCWQWNRTYNKTDFKQYIQVFLQNNQDASGWSDVDFTYEGMLLIHKNLFHTLFDPSDTDFLGSILDPRKQTSIINSISKFDDSGLRDNYVLDQIENYWNKGMSMFIIYGSPHAVMQEPVLRDLVG